MENFWTFMKSINQSIKSSIIVRIILITILILFLLIPTSSVKRLIYERESRRQGVINDINSKWAYNQTFTGPILEVPYKKYFYSKWKDKKGITHEKTTTEIRYAFFLPENLNITGTVIPEYRKRGIYSTAVYIADLKIKGYFSFPDFSQLQINSKNIMWNSAVITFGISDMRGINKTIEMKWNKDSAELKPGVKNSTVLKKGVYTPVNIIQNKNSIQTFDIDLNFKGSSELSFIPIGRETKVAIKSNWTSPSFNGNFIPNTRNISDKGFDATWNIFDFNRDFPQLWKGTEISTSFENFSFGFELFLPVDEYHKGERSVKYALLFIILTFATVFFLFEIINKKRIHPIQYLLVGFALTLFYLLLISLSEHIPFNVAYFIASLSIVILITLYSISICKKGNLSVILCLLLSSLYGFLFFTLQLEDYSLLVGSIGLFIILSSTMIFTRKIDWYNFKLSRVEENK